MFEGNQARSRASVQQKSILGDREYDRDLDPYLGRRLLRKLMKNKNAIASMPRTIPAAESALRCEARPKVTNPTATANPTIAE